MTLEKGKTDRRVVKTKKAIYKAITELLSEKEIQEIKVKELADRADINRKTFYYYYSDIYALLDEMEDNIVDYFAELVKEIDPQDALRNPAGQLFDKIEKVTSSNISSIEALFRTVGNSSLVYKAVKRIVEISRDKIGDSYDCPPETLDTVIRFIVSGEIGAFQAWFHSDRRESLESLTRTISCLVTGGLNAFRASMTLEP